jgi:hypothetical protein
VVDAQYIEQTPVLTIPLLFGMAKLSEYISGEPSVVSAFSYLDGPPNINNERKVYLPPLSSPENAPTFTTIPDVPLHDLRGKEHTLDIETNGFQFVRHSTSFHLNPSKKNDIKEYILETTALVQKALNAESVLCYDYKVISYVQLWIYC